MYLKNSSFSIPDKSLRDIDNSSIDYPTLDDLMNEQNIESKNANSVHHRRDLDSLG